MQITKEQVTALCHNLGIQENDIDPNKIPKVLRSIDDYYSLIAQLGLLGQQQEKTTWHIEDNEERLNIIKHKLKFIGLEKRPSVLMIETFQPLTSANTSFYNSLIQIAGGGNLLEDNYIINPGLIIVLAKEIPMQEYFSSLPMIMDLPEWKETEAVKNNNIYLVDGTKHFSTDLLQVIDDTELLAEIIFPQYFVFGNEDESWMKFDLG